MPKTTQFTGSITAASIYEVVLNAHHYTITNIRKVNDVPYNDYSFDTPESTAWWLATNIERQTTPDGTQLTVDSRQEGALEGLNIFLEHNRGVVIDGLRTFFLVNIHMAARVTALAAQQTNEQRRQPRPQWRFAAHITRNNEFYLRAMSSEETPRNVLFRCPEALMRYTQDPRELRVTLTCVTDIDNFIQPFLSECGHQIEPDEKARLDAEIVRLRRALPATADAIPDVIPANLLMQGMNMVLDLVTSFRDRMYGATRTVLLNDHAHFLRPLPQLTYQQRLQNIQAHPEFDAMVNRMLANGSLPTASNQLQENTKAQFDEHIAQWLDPVTYDLMQDPVLIPVEAERKPRTLVDRTTYDVIMRLPNVQDRINPVTRELILPDHLPVAATETRSHIQQFLADCEQELIHGSSLAFHPLRYFW